MSRILLTYIILIIVSVFIFAYSYAVYSPYRISSDEARKLIKNKKIDLILDVRTDFERSRLGFYPGSVHIQSADLDKKIPILFPNKKIHILAYCNTGHRARLATDKLHALGYKNVVFISSQYTSLI